MRLPWCHSLPHVTSEADGTQPEIGSDMGSFSPVASSCRRLDQNSALRKEKSESMRQEIPFSKWQIVLFCFFFPLFFPGFLKVLSSSLPHQSCLHTRNSTVQGKRAAA